MDRYMIVWIDVQQYGQIHDSMDRCTTDYWYGYWNSMDTLDRFKIAWINVQQIDIYQQYGGTMDYT